MKLEITTLENCEYDSDRIGKNDKFMSVSALYSQSEKRTKTC